MAPSTDHRPIRFLPYLLIRVIPVATIVMAIAWFAGHVITQNIAESKADELLVRQSKETQNIIQLRMRNIHEQVKNLAGISLVVNGLIDLEGRDNYLPAFFQTLRLAGYPNANIQLTDYKGRNLFETSTATTANPLLDNWRRNAAKSGNPHTHLASYGLVFVEPVLYLNNPEGAIVATLGKDELADLFNVGAQLNETVAIGPDGEIIYSSNKEFGLVGELFSQVQKPDMRVADTSVEGFPGVRVMTLQWQDVALASQQWIENFLIVVLLVALLALGGAIAATVYIATRNVTALSTVVRKIAGTADMEERVELSGPAELCALGEDFNNMLETLQRTTTSYDYVDSIISNSAEGIVTIDTSGRIEIFNPAAERIFGYASKEATSQDIAMLMHGNPREIQRVFAENSSTDPSGAIGSTRTLEGRRKDGTLFPMELNAAPMRISGDQKFIGIFRDISERRKAEEAQQVAKEEAEAANRAKSEFLSAMSHEIRTPMAGVLGLADLLLEDDLSSTQRLTVQKIKGAGQSLVTILNDILDLSKIQAGKFEIETIDFDLGGLISDSLELLKPKADEKGIELASEIAPEVPDGLHGDPTRTRQILINLLGNAVKFTERGGVTLRVGILERNNDDMILRFEVVDTGIGIAKDRQTKLFHDFTQLDASTARKYEGTGLGLAISRKLVELMGGEIGVESEEGEGATFWFTLPGKSAELKVKRAANRPSEVEFCAVRPLRILLAEDNELNQMIIMAVLAKFDHVVTTVDNGREAVDAARDGDYDLVLMDVRMPEMDGPDAARIIRQQTSSKSDIPIIAVTADAILDNREDYFRAGMNACVTKPINQPELLRAINDVLAEDIHVPVAPEFSSA